MTEWQLYDYDALVKSDADACYVMGIDATEPRLIIKKPWGGWEFGDDNDANSESLAFMQLVPKVHAPSIATATLLQEEHAFHAVIDDASTIDGRRALVCIHRQRSQQFAQAAEKLEWANDDLEREKKHKQIAEETGGNVPFFEERIAKAERSISLATSRRDRLGKKLEMLHAGVKANLLPIGTHVRMIADPAEEPQSVREAVVLGATDVGEWPIELAVLIADDGKPHISEHTMAVADLFMLEILGHGRFVDGAICENYEVVGTHMPRTGQKKTAMIVESAGRFWDIGVTMDSDGRFGESAFSMKDLGQVEKHYDLLSPPSGAAPHM